MTWESSIAHRRGRTVVTLSGRLDESTHDAVYDLVVAQVSARDTDVVELDLGGVSFLGACGAAALIAAHFVGRGAGCRVTVVRRSAAAQRTLLGVGALQLIGAAPQDGAGPRPRTWIRQLWFPARRRRDVVTVDG
jgi:anti-anti-sigma factor